MTTKLVGFFFAALAAIVVFAGPAAAGSKWQTNLVPQSDTDPTITAKSKVLFKDKGTLSAKLDGLTDVTGTLVTSDESWKKFTTINGDEYFVIVSGEFPALGVDFVFNLLVEPKAGKGKGKLDASGLFALIPAGVHRASELKSVKVVGPLGAANAVDCRANIQAGGFVILGGLNPCDQGDLIGVGGVLLP